MGVDSTNVMELLDATDTNGERHKVLHMNIGVSRVGAPASTSGAHTFHLLPSFDELQLLADGALSSQADPSKTFQVDVR